MVPEQSTTPILLVGGIPYSGKSSLVRELSSKHPDRYLPLVVDDLHDRVENDPNLFFTALASFYPQMITNCGMDISQLDSYDLGAKYKALQSEFSRQGPQIWMIMLQQVVSSHIVDRLADDSDKTPVIETLLLNKVMRQALFSSYLEMIEVKDSSFDLLASPKTLVYLDPGLDVSLDRYNSNPERPMVNDQVIELTHSQQELPVASELPNLEVVIPHSESEIADFIAKA